MHRKSLNSIQRFMTGFPSHIRIISKFDVCKSGRALFLQRRIPLISCFGAFGLHARPVLLKC